MISAIIEMKYALTLIYLILISLIHKFNNGFLFIQNVACLFVIVALLMDFIFFVCYIIKKKKIKL